MQRGDGLCPGAPDLSLLSPSGPGRLVGSYGVVVLLEHSKEL